jgi:hypothetical protein
MERSNIDVGQRYQLIDGQLVVFMFQAAEPTGRDLIAGVIPRLGKAETPFFHLTATRVAIADELCEVSDRDLPPLAIPQDSAD